MEIGWTASTAGGVAAAVIDIVAGWDRLSEGIDMSTDTQGWGSAESGVAVRLNAPQPWPALIVITTIDQRSEALFSSYAGASH